MLSYTFHRVLAFIPTIFIALTLIFIVTRLVPGSPVWALLGNQSVGAAKIEEVEHQLGLDRPVLEQYVEWLPRVVTGDFGQSIFYSKPVARIIAERSPITLNLTILAMIVTIAVGVPLGIVAALRRGGF